MLINGLSRRSLLKDGSRALAAGLLPWPAHATTADPNALVRVNLNESAFGPSPKVVPAIERALSNVSRYGDEDAARAFTEQIAAYEGVAVDQVVLGEILGELGLSLGSDGGPGGEFVYSTPGYLALIDAASRVGGVGVPVALNAQYENDLVALQSKLNSRTRAVYLINPHNPTGTVSDDRAFKSFLEQASKQALVIVDEAYLEFTADFRTRSAVSLVREGANVVVFRTFDKIHGLAGLPIGYAIAPRKLAASLHAQGLGNSESLGRLNMAAAAAALDDKEHVEGVRLKVRAERDKWQALLQELRLPHTRSEANFIFFNAGRPHAEVAQHFKDGGVLVARAFPPLGDWIRITVGTAFENGHVQQVLRQMVGHILSSS